MWYVNFIFFVYTGHASVILVLIGVQYLQNIVFSFEKGLNGQNHSLSDSHHLIWKISPSKISYSPSLAGGGGGVADFSLPLNVVWKTLVRQGKLFYVAMFCFKYHVSDCLILTHPLNLILIFLLKKMEKILRIR